MRRIKTKLSIMGSIILTLAMMLQVSVPVYGAGPEDDTTIEVSGSGDITMLDTTRNDERVAIGTSEIINEIYETISEDSIETESESKETLDTEDDPILIWRTNDGRGPINSKGSNYFASRYNFEKIQFAFCRCDHSTGKFYYVNGMNTFTVNVNASDGAWHPITFDTTGLTYGEYYLVVDYVWLEGQRIEIPVGAAENYYFKILTPDELVGAFVERMYKTVLERNADANGLVVWTNDLRSGARDGASLADGFVMSDEFIRKGCDNKTFINILYFSFLGRIPSDSEVASWENELQNGKCRAEVLAGFVNSNEFGEICSNFGIRQGNYQAKPRAAVSATKMNVNSAGANRGRIAEYVERMYTQALGRASEASGKEYWINEIISGQQYDAATVAKVGFFESTEYKNKHTSDAQFVTDAYHAFFGREPDEGGYYYWLKMLATGEYDRPGMIETGFGHSTEFKNLLGSYGFVVTE